MKAIFFVLLSSLAIGSIGHAYSGTGSGGTCFSYSCRIVLDEPTKDEALSALVNRTELSSHLRSIVEEQRALEEKHRGSSARGLTDDQLLRILYFGETR